jgi:RNA polymerase sigma-70 factor (ECF subfamily)
MSAHSLTFRQRERTVLIWMSSVFAVPSQPPADEGPPDAGLAARAKGDRQAFALLYRRYAGRVYSYCYSRLGSREAAEDATSQTFCNVLQALSGCEVGSFRGWLFTIAHNVVVDLRRRQRPHAPLEADGDPVDGAPTPEDLALLAEERRSLRAALALLSADQRRVVELRLAGFAGGEIAAQMGRSPGSVKMLQFRALERLRVLLHAQAGTGEVRRGAE